uniref:Transcription initiation factor TFIID subunit 8 n=1 Tax=Heliothis virescens TaxID=7102 RepID=A0A2A4K4F1_HELVI
MALVIWACDSAPPASPSPRTPAMLSAGSKAKAAPHIPFNLPPLPDPHAYIRTPTHKQPVTEYEAIREKAASQKRDIERALTKFLAKTSETHNLFNTEDNQVFHNLSRFKDLEYSSNNSLQANIPGILPCLLPTDQVFDFEELRYHFAVNNRTEDMPADKKDQSDNEGDNMGDGDNPNSSQMDNPDTSMASSPERSKAVDKHKLMKTF